MKKTEKNASPAPLAPLPPGHCPWPGDDAEYRRYHNEEWGVPQTDDRKLFEKLVLESFQSGLSWITILRKRPAFRTAFDDFDPEKIARFDDTRRAALMADTGIVRNRAKIDATIGNAQAFLRLREENGAFASFLWQFVDGRPIQNNFEAMSEVPASTDRSTAMAKALKAAGFRFVGPTTAYAFMQSMGLVNDHLIGCPSHDICRTMGEKIEVRA